MKLRRYRFEDSTWYVHPNGWRIRRHERDWSIRGFGGGIYELTAAGNPRVWWEVTRTSQRRQASATAEFLTLRDARAWCDRHCYDADGVTIAC